jgi:hypothetical protein
MRRQKEKEKEKENRTLTDLVNVILESVDIPYECWRNYSNIKFHPK